MFLLTIYLPWLLNMLPYSYWALTCLAVLPTYSAFMISVRQASDLPPASFRFPVTQDTLALGYILPAVGRIGDFHPLKHAPAGRTKNMIPGSSIQELLWDLFSTNLLPTVLIIQISLVKIIKNAPWRILVPRAVACDNLHLRASMYHSHVSAFCVIGNSL